MSYVVVRQLLHSLRFFHYTIGPDDIAFLAIVWIVLQVGYLSRISSAGVSVRILVRISAEWHFGKMTII